jgi:hypothetical protein
VSVQRGNRGVSLLRKLVCRLSGEAIPGGTSREWWVGSGSAFRLQVSPASDAQPQRQPRRGGKKGTTGEKGRVSTYFYMLRQGLLPGNQSSRAANKVRKMQGWMPQRRKCIRRASASNVCDSPFAQVETLRSPPVHAVSRHLAQDEREARRQWGAGTAAVGRDDRQSTRAGRM